MRIDLGQRTRWQNDPPSVLVVDDAPALGQVVCDALRQHGYRTKLADGAVSALLGVDSDSFSVVVSDLQMPGLSGIELCGQLSHDAPGLPVVLMTAFGSIDRAIEAMRAGAFDFLQKPFELDELQVRVQDVFARVVRLASRYVPEHACAGRWLFAITVRLLQERRRYVRRFANAMSSLSRQKQPRGRHAEISAEPTRARKIRLVQNARLRVSARPAERRCVRIGSTLLGSAVDPLPQLLTLGSRRRRRASGRHRLAGDLRLHLALAGLDT